ncbi:lanthionine synthetase C family protein [Paenibacillus sp. IB182496]|uniref:Lanthionine synthetase C family protein n=1 Tax=Paenibacillus sabuli TaxID=2772509 RepID=A0A927BV96_9BACL|nr:lanthionine synthetase C family protein [Paenibacillus sabuli]MBD2847468.1 lanthionine synthetase C family protein [Paenibacillus sabuli]
MSAQLFRETVTAMNRYTLSNLQLHRRDWLFPTDPSVFNTNPLNVAVGAMGVLYSMHKTGAKIPTSAYAWVFSQNINNDNYPPGLYMGISGISWVFWDLGFKERAMRLMDQAAEHPLLYRSANLFYGASGYGVTCLYFYMETLDEKWLERARIIGDWLLTIGPEHALAKNYCMEHNGDTFLGYARGNSGVALFLLYLYQLTKDLKFYKAGEAALQFDISYLQETEEQNLSVPRGKISELENVFTHYWLDGSAGIVSVLWRYWAISGKKEYFQKASSLILDTFRTFTVFPGLFRGAAGLGNSLLEAHYFTGEQKYLDQAIKIGHSILLFQIKREEGIAFPGEQLFRISTDFGTGMAGISLFINSLSTQQAESCFHFLLSPVALDNLCKKD